MNIKPQLMNNTLPSGEQTYTKVDGVWSIEDSLIDTHKALDEERYNTLLSSCYPDLTTSTSWVSAPMATVTELPVTLAITANHYTKEEVDALIGELREEIALLRNPHKKLIDELLANKFFLA